MFSLHSKFSTMYASGEEYHKYTLLDNAGNSVVHIMFQEPINDVIELSIRLGKYIPDGDMIYQIFEEDKDSKEYIRENIMKWNKKLRMYAIKEAASQYEV